MGLLLLVLFSVHSAQLNATPPVVETVAAFCRPIASEIGVRLDVDPKLSGLPIFVNRRSLSGRQILDEVAFALRASIVSTKYGLALKETKADEDRTLADLRTFWRRRLTGWFDELDAHQRGAASFGDPYARYSHYKAIYDEQNRRLADRKQPNFQVTLNVLPDEFAPTGQLYANIIRSIGVDRLIATKPDVRRIWSNQPKPGQFRVSNGDDLLLSYARGQRAFLIRKAPASPFRSPARFTLRQVGGTSFKLNIYDAEGMSIGQYSGPPFDFQMQGPFLVSAARLTRKFVEDKSAWRPIDPETVRVNHFIGFPARFGEVDKSDLPEVLVRPDLKDPLDYLVSTGLEAIAEKIRGRGFVAVATDQMLEYADGCVSREGFNARAFEAMLGGEWEFDRLNHNEVVILRPADPSRWRRQTVNREKLAQQCAALLREEKIGLTAIAKAQLALFPQGDSRVAKRILERIYWFRPHMRSRVLFMSGDELAWLGAIFDATGGQSRSLQIDPQVEPFRSLINRGVNAGWLRFEASTLTADSELDPAVEPMESPWISVDFASEPRLGIYFGSEADRMADELPLNPVSSICSVIGSTLVKSGFSPSDAVNDDEVSFRIGKLGFFHVGSGRAFVADFYPRPALRFRMVVQEDQVDQSNLGFDQLSSDVKGAVIAGTLGWIRLYRAGKIPSNATNTFGPTTDERRSPPPW